MAHLELSIPWHGSTEQPHRPTYLKFENRRTICTSVSLRASTRVSSGFAPLRHSSPSFGSRQVCSHSNPSQKVGVGRRCTHRGIPPISFLAPYGFTHPLTRTHVRLLGPCFKTGRMGSPQADARSMHVPRHARGRMLPSTIATMTSPRAYQQPGLGPPSQSASVRAPSRSADRLSPFHIRPGHIADPHPLPSRQFQALFDSLFKVLFIFPSRYLFAIGLSPVFSLGRNLPPDWGCIPKQPDSPTAPRGATGSGHNGALTLSGAPFQGTWARSATEDASPDYNSNARGDRFSWQACPQPNGFGRNLRSKTRWFTGFCNSHQVSHFATFFIDARAEISVAESHFASCVVTTPAGHRLRVPKNRPLQFQFPWHTKRRGLCFIERERLGCANHDQPPPDRRGAQRTCRPFVGSVDFSQRRGQRTAHVAAIRTLHRTIQSACFEHSNFFKVTAPEARPGQLRPGAHRRQKGRANRCTPEADRSTQPKVQLRAF
ncbi:hypothetical protein VNO78_34874 [Psophocarpus tetragonolobus]|uniref:Uncharacterized protein n=1 Tax=Psophocarpus tetragonolobus TaxID=3891 RepID=A0AAN9NUU0_PSOTE